MVKPTKANLKMVWLTMNKVNMAKLIKKKIFYGEPIMHKLIMTEINMNEIIMAKSKWLN